MANLTPEEIEAQKRAMYEGLSPRRRRFVDKIGFENWDPFQMPFDPIDLRVDQTGHTPQQLANAFFRTLPEPPGPDYASSVATFAVELVHNFERARPVMDFCIWYAKLMQQRGLRD